MKLCAKCNEPTDGLLWIGPYWYCWTHFYNATATERVRTASLTLSDIAPMVTEVYNNTYMERNDVY